MAGKLNSRKVETITTPGRHSDGGNLYLSVSPTGAKRWTFFYRFGGGRREMGLGSAGPNGVSLKDARDKAMEAWAAFCEPRASAKIVPMKKPK